MTRVVMLLHTFFVAVNLLTSTVFPQIVSSEIILFWIWPQSQYIKVQKLFKGRNYSRNVVNKNEPKNQPIAKQIKSEQFWASEFLSHHQTFEQKYNHTKAAQNTWCLKKQIFLLSPSFFLTNMKSSKLELKISQEEALQQLGCITVEWW